MRRRGVALRQQWAGVRRDAALKAQILNLDARFRSTELADFPELKVTRNDLPPPSAGNGTTSAVQPYSLTNGVENLIQEAFC